MVRLLVEAGCAVDSTEDSSNKSTPLLAAAHGGHAEIVKVGALLSSSVLPMLFSGAERCGLSVHRRCCWRLARKCTRAPTLERCVALLMFAHSPNQCSQHCLGCIAQTAMLLAAEKGRVEVMKLLMQWGCNANTASTAGQVRLVLCFWHHQCCALGRLRCWWRANTAISGA